MNFCSKCGNKLDSNHEYCSSCEQQMNVENDNQKGIDIKAFISGFLIPVIPMIIIAAVVLLIKPNQYRPTICTQAYECKSDGNGMMDCLYCADSTWEYGGEEPCEIIETIKCPAS